MSSEEELDYDEDDVEEEIEDAPVEQKKRKTAKKGGGKKIKDPNKPKRNMTAFFLYSNANRAKIKAEYPEATFGELAKIIGERYKSISDNERILWEQEALKDKERYNEEMQHYVSMDFDSGKKRAKKDPNAPKRNMSAYFLFSIAARPAYKKANPDASFGDLAKIISQAYKNLPDYEKQKWVEKAEHDKIRYQKELASYG